MEMLRLVRRSSRPASRSRSARISGLEPLELRRLLSAAPVAADDAYELGANNRLEVGDFGPPLLPAFDESAPVPTGPTGPFTEPDLIRDVGPGQVVVEPDSIEGGHQANAFAEVNVHGAGARWTVSEWTQLATRGKATLTVTDGGVADFNNWLDLGTYGVADMTVSNGGTVNARNWTEVGSAESSPTGVGGGAATLTVTGALSRWNSSNWMSVGYGRSAGTLRLLDGAMMRLGLGAPFDHTGWLTVGDYMGFGDVEISGGASLVGNNFVTVGDNRGRGALRVADGGKLTTGNWASIGNNGGFGTVSLSGAGSRWTLNNHLSVGENTGRGVLSLADGAMMSVANWVEIGRYDGSDGRVLVGSGSTFSYRDFLNLGISQTGNSRATLYVAEGGRVLGGSNFGQPPEIYNYAGGRILGSGSIQGRITNQGFISPGGSIGLLTINGSIFQPATSSGTIQFDIGGTQRGTEYDALDVVSQVEVTGGKVVLNFVNGFAPREGDRFELIDSGTLNTVPPNVEVRGLSPDFEYHLGFEGDRLVLTANNDGTSAPLTVQRNGVLANDTDADGDALTAVLTRRPQHGTLNLYRNGSFSYLPGPTFAGTDSFEYKADDGVFTSAPATVTIRNLAPTARDDAYAADENTPLVVPAAAGVLSNDSDSVSTTLTAQLVDGPDHGTLMLNPDGSFTYTPAADFNGTDTFTYRASDGSVTSAPATVTITVRPGNSNPVAVADSMTVRQGHDLRFDARDLLANDTDPDGDRLAVTGVSATADTHGTVSLSRGRITYRPDRSYAGPASFTYTIGDGHGGVATGTVNVTVLPKHRGNRGSAVGAGALGGGRRQFTFAVSARGSGDDFAIRGTLTYRDVARKLALRAGDIDLFEISSDGRTVTIAGSASVNGQGGYRFELTAEDRSRSGHNDRFRIRVTGPSPFTYDSGGNDRIERGNVVIVRPGHDDDDDD